MSSLRDTDPHIQRDREAIDSLDASIIELLRRRMATSRRIQQRRVSGGGPRMVLAREMAILHRYREELGAPGTAIAINVLELCRGTAGQPVPATGTAAVPAPPADLVAQKTG